MFFSFGLKDRHSLQVERSKNGFCLVEKKKLVKKILFPDLVFHYAPIFGRYKAVLNFGHCKQSLIHLIIYEKKSSLYILRFNDQRILLCL
jgi:hypothetical protein